MWNVAQARFDLLVQLESRVRYRNESGAAFLPIMALYDHDGFTLLESTFESNTDWQAVTGDDRHTCPHHAVRTWIRRTDLNREGGSRINSKITLTPSQIWVECDSPDRLDGLKHELASTFGFLLHFRGETLVSPMHTLTMPDLSVDGEDKRLVTVALQEEQRLIASFLETVYLDWADKPAPALGDQTPRHAVTVPDGRKRVSALIDEIECHDVGRRRTGTVGYDYGVLRAHVGL
jgi:hypothetical protein